MEGTGQILKRGNQGRTVWPGAVAVWGVLSLVLAWWLRAPLTGRPLWYDELFTAYVVRQGDPLSLVHALLAGADNGPPLDYLPRQLSVALLGDHVWTLRLASVAMLAATVLVVARLGRVLGGSAGALVAALLVLASSATDYGVEARAYAALEASAVLAVAAWWRATRPGATRGDRVALGLVLAAGPLVHFYGVVNFVPVVVAEGVRAIRRGRPDRGLLCAIGGGTVSIPIMALFARHAWTMRAHFWAGRFGWGSVLESYRHLLPWPAVAVALVAFVGAWAVRSRPDADDERDRSALRAGVITLCLTPVTVWLVAHGITHAMTARYALATTGGFALLGAMAVARGPRSPLWRGLVVALAALAAGLHVRSLPITDGEPVPAEWVNRVLQTDDPVAVESPQLFLALQERWEEPARGRLRYLSDREASRRWLGFDNDEIALPLLAAHAGLWVVPLNEALRSARRWTILVGPHRYWLLEELRSRHWQLVRLRRDDHYELWRAIAPDSPDSVEAPVEDELQPARGR